LNDTGSLRNLVFSGYKSLLATRTSNAAFHPNGEQKALNLNKGIFSVLRSSPNGEKSVICIHNVQSKSLNINMRLSDLGINRVQHFKDLLSNKLFMVENNTVAIKIEPYSVLWIEAEFADD
jgi:sucrose phosphorylase